MRRLILFILNFITVLVVMTIAINILWEQFIDERIYDCTDPVIGYLNLPGEDWPVVSVKHIISDRPINDPDMILDGWTVDEIWWLAGGCLAISLSVSFLLAWNQWPVRLNSHSIGLLRRKTHSF